MTKFKILSIDRLGQATETDDLGRTWPTVLEAVSELCNEEGWRPSFVLEWPNTTDLYLIHAGLDGNSGTWKLTTKES